MKAEKLLIVEGLSDKKRIQKVLSEQVAILCTNGTVSSYRVEELLYPFEGYDLYVFMDADDSGDKLRQLFIREYPEAIHLYTERLYGQVEKTPLRKIAEILLRADFKVHPEFLLY